MLMMIVGYTLLETA